MSGSRYKDSLRAGEAGVRTPVTRDFLDPSRLSPRGPSKPSVQQVSGLFTAGGQRPKRGADHSSHSSVEDDNWLNKLLPLLCACLTRNETASPLPEISQSSQNQGDTTRWYEIFTKLGTDPPTRPSNKTHRVQLIFFWYVLNVIPPTFNGLGEGKRGKKR
jgi:hypothetical protein